MAGGGGAGLAAGAADRRPRDRSKPVPPGSTGYTEDAGAEAEADGGERPGPDPAVVAAARAIAARLAVARPRDRASRRRGAGRLTSVPYSGTADEIDLDATLDVIAERRPLRREDVVVRERRRIRRAVVLAVDVSGSMRGERIRTAAAAVGALTAELARDDLAVIAFWSDAAVLLRLGEDATLERLVDALLAIEPTGLTNIAFPLEFAERELRRMGDRRQRVLLLSDCVHNAGPDPRAVALRLPRLDVLLDVSGEQDAEVARDLARCGRGLVQAIHTHRDVAPALSRILAPTDR